MDSREQTCPTVVSECATVLVAIELSGKSWLVGVQSATASRPSVHRLAAGDSAGLLALIARLRATGVRVVTCYEAGRDGFWLHRLLTQAGVVNHVIDPASLRVQRRARRAKTDRIDVEALLRALAAWLRGVRDECRMVRVPSEAEEDARRLHRERQRLVCERVEHVNRIKALLALHGILDFQPLRADRRARLDGLRTASGAGLPIGLKQEIVRELDRLELIVHQIGSLEAIRDAQLTAPDPAEPAAGKIQSLARLKAIGAELATVLTREVFYRDFRNRREVGRYVGLDPSPFNSGGMVRDQGIAKAGNPRARTAMIELAWLWLRYQPDSALSRWFRTRVGTAGGRIKRIHIVALARKLLVALWRYLTTGLVPEGAVLKA
jgi:transposase